MNVIAKDLSESASAKEGLALLRTPFAPHHISKLPKPTKRQTEEVKNNYKKGIRCKLCGQWHHPDVQHLDYVGHAALTDRLLDSDPTWNWEPVAFDERGAPMRDSEGGMWIRLTVCGQTRLGYGHADGKRGGDAVKEVIGDALRNAAMRFGAALDLWHKGDLHVFADDVNAVSEDMERSNGQPSNQAPKEPLHNKEPKPNNQIDPVSESDRIITRINKTRSLPELEDAFKGEWGVTKWIGEAEPGLQEMIMNAKERQKAKLTPPDPARQAPDTAEYLADEIRY